MAQYTIVIQSQPIRKSEIRYNSLMEVFLIAAMTADGFIARRADQVSTAWTSREDKQWFVQKTKQAKVCVMGRTTYETIGAPRSGRSILVLSSSGKTTLEDQDLELGQMTKISLSPTELVARLQELQVEQLAVCGGASVYTQFLQAGLINRLYLTVEPVIFGTGLSLFNQNLMNQISLVDIHRLSGQTVVLEYKAK